MKGQTTRMRIPAVLWTMALLMGAALFILGCGGSDTSSSDQPVAASEASQDAAAEAPADQDDDHADQDAHADEGEAHTEDAVSRGREVYLQVGCVACHGQDAEGSAIAPALAGHTEDQLRRQVRPPVGIMPVFSSETIDEGRLSDLIAYVTSLGGGHAHAPTGGRGAEMEMHHWMAVFSIEDGNATEAMHHIQHIIELTEGDHQARMRAVLEKVEAGDLHDIAHEVEEMLAGVLSEQDANAMHLRLALSSVRVEDADGAAHHLEHFSSLATGHDLEAAEEILTLLRAADLEKAEHELTAILESLGVAVDAGGHAEAEEGGAEAEEGGHTE